MNLKLLSKSNILVFGDVMLDRYISGSVDRVSPEAPVPVLKPIKEEIRLRGDGNITKQINILYTLFTQDYTLGKRNSRLPLVFHSIGFLTHEINFSLPIRNNFKIFVQVQCNVNKMFESKKKNENNNKKPIQRNLKKKEDIKIEIVQDKISIFNELDSLF